ncbi:MAG: radical SAM protein [bacterium]|nr:radical SAM protein [bacterium]
MNKIVFVYPPVVLEGRYKEIATGREVQPQGLYSLAAVVRQHQFEPYILDARILGMNIDKTVNAIIDRNPQYVGITAMTMSINSAAKIANGIKRENPEITIIIGGPHISALPEETMQEFPCFDVGVIGEGEITIVELLQAIENKKRLNEINGLIFREENRIIKTQARSYIKDLDILPLPAWDMTPELTKLYRQSVSRINKVPAVSITVSRGCPNKCTFCARNVFGNTSRIHSVEYIMEIIKYLRDNYKIRSVAFEDENLLVHKSIFYSLCETIIRERINISWSCASRVDTVDKEILALMKRADCWSISYGIESGCQRILDLEKKRITLEQVRQAVQWTKEAGINSKGYFIIGHPAETKQSIKETITFAKTIGLDDFQMSFMIPFPGTDLYKTAKQYGNFSPEWSKMNIWTPVFIPYGLTQKDLNYYSKKAFRGFYFRPQIIWSFLRRALDVRYIVDYVRDGFRVFQFLLRK